MVVEELVRKCLCNCPPDCEECPTKVFTDFGTVYYLCDCESPLSGTCYCGKVERHVHCICN